MGLFGWLLGRDATPRPYIRREPRNLIDRYDLPRARVAQPTPPTETLLQALEGATGLRRDSREFSVAEASLREAAEAFRKATRGIA